MRFFGAAALVLICSSAVAQDAWVPRGTADLVLLDKIKGIPSSVPVKAGERWCSGR